MNAKPWNGDYDRDHPSVEEPEQHGDGECECHCDRCGAQMELDPIFGKVWSRCGDCYGGGEIDGEAFRGNEAAGYAAEQMARVYFGLKR